MYPEEICTPMRLDLTEAGFEEMRNAEEQFDIKIVRIEQLYPFPKKNLIEILKLTPKADVVWCQEEPKNMGGWTFVRDYIEEAMHQSGLNTDRPIYCGRDAAASAAIGGALGVLLGSAVAIGWGYSRGMGATPITPIAASAGAGLAVVPELPRIISGRRSSTNKELIRRSTLLASTGAALGLAVDVFRGQM